MNKRMLRINEWTDRVRHFKHWDILFFPALVGVMTFVPFVLIMSCLVVMAVFILAPYQLGQQEAVQQIKAYTACEIDKIPSGQTCTFLYEADQQKLVAKGMYITKSENQIALYDEGKTGIYLTHDRIFIIVIGKTTI